MAVGEYWPSRNGRTWHIDFVKSSEVFEFMLFLVHYKDKKANLGFRKQYLGLFIAREVGNLVR